MSSGLKNLLPKISILDDGDLKILLGIFYEDSSKDYNLFLDLYQIHSSSTDPKLLLEELLNENDDIVHSYIYNILQLFHFLIIHESKLK